MGAAALRWFAEHPEADREEAERLLLRVPPEGIEERASTAGTACDHPRVAFGLRWAWERLRAGEPPTATALAHKLNMSPRTLERLLQKHLGRSAHDYLLGIRIDWARQLLRASPDMPLAQVGELCGFSKPGQFSETFLKHVGKSPRECRKMT